MLIESEGLIELWNQLEHDYVSVMEVVLISVKEHMDLYYQKVWEIQQSFVELLERGDNKAMLFHKFQENYSRFLEENPQIRDMKLTRQEILAKLEVLYDKMWDILAAKKDEAIAQRKHLIESGYFEEDLEVFMKDILKLIKSELLRFFRSLKLLRSYYCQLLGKKEPTQSAVIDFADVENESSVICDPRDPESFPRLQKIIKNCLKLIENFVRNFEYSSPEESEAVQCEFTIIKYRIHLIKNFALGRIKTFRGFAKLVYAKMDEWIIFQIKSHNDSVYKLTKTLRNRIERGLQFEDRLPLGLALTTELHKPIQPRYDVLESIPARESVSPKRFTIENLYFFMMDLESISDDGRMIDSEYLKDYLNKKWKLQPEIFPDDFNQKDAPALSVMSSKIGQDSQGKVSWRRLCTYLCLLDSPVPGTEMLQDLLTSLEGSNIDRDSFIWSSFWFDEYVQSYETIDHYRLDRAYSIKQLLFYIHSDKENLLVESFIECLRPLSGVSQDDGLLYFDLLFHGQKDFNRRVIWAGASFIDSRIFSIPESLTCFSVK
eukprot:TRINITY_DN8429_c0_g2_i7.p1 TRINITY_DN8429_c0_g2~~TRINITY_DN8429_c0_g2_i7.p1  ORF type:complete len:546 (-),score=78.37 TRINITY_DN8429_c0_g2_i7:141-1778(-)